MRRTERLFQIIQIMRRTRRPITATEIAGELETSVRTVYRDIAELMAQQVPVRGEAGIGYVLEAGFDMPPLMLTPDEIEAAMLGAQWVAGQGDETLARAAQDFVAKVTAVTPARLRPFLLEPAGAAAMGCRTRVADAINMTALRAAIHSQQKIHLRYCAENASETERTVWPIAIGYFETVRLIAAWCELRGDFRHFRTDRVVSAAFLEERYPGRRTHLRKQWSLAQRATRLAAE
ncbi:MAG: YafY family protein [Amphiplicatus sp.]